MPNQIKNLAEVDEAVKHLFVYLSVFLSTMLKLKVKVDIFIVAYIAVTSDSHCGGDSHCYY